MEGTSTTPQFVIASNEVAKKIFSVVDSGSVHGPPSITALLSLLQLGSSGETDKQITKFLGSKFTQSEQQTALVFFNNNFVKMTNVLLISHVSQPKPGYLDAARTVACVLPGNFQQKGLLSELINNFVSGRTNGMIKDIISPNDITADARTILVNTLYFDAAWKMPFNVKKTKSAVFNNALHCELMFQSEDFPYYEDDRVQMLRMLYENQEYAMEFFLARQADQVVYPFNPERVSEQRVLAYIPKFKQRSKLNLIPILQKLGLTNMFDPFSAEFGNMAGEPTFVSKMIHETVVDVNESRTTAASATLNMMVGITSADSKFFTFRADRTFSYRIIHLPTQTTLFVGVFDGKTETGKN